ncbi:nitrogenase iron-molybdenum cofactor biosynthesis protein NifE [Gottschalkia purinilytica]|uniref:Nitrogenase iron-molybdenum cofactor biosynthesis protein NifE n=1 Tax=Gottschalkia purinilytica TaxID=1503 RepID=A0A0L0WAY3_GOTPU|nr:nitrogenase component 1 [Gottschalkia purinilytica]KNF08653.1 nitrogenase iron-molybdenum cofactor biosynthesis protein NifE [Gottschalkia purinilytica]
MTINLLNEDLQIRENRLGSITGYHGSAKDLSNCSRKSVLNDRERSFTQCSSCSSGTAICQLAMIQDAVVINHAPLGCSGDFPEFNFINRTGQIKRKMKLKNVRLISTNLREKDMIYGGNEKLEKTIKEAYERYNPKAIFVTTSCGSGIIGDDVNGAVEKAESELGIPIVPIFCEGFRSKIWATGFDAAYHGILKKIVKPPKNKSNNIINIINFWGDDYFSNLFEKLGLIPNYIVPFTTITQLEKLSEAAATIQVCSTLGTYFSTALEQEFGVPEVKSPPPYGILGTDIWLRELGNIVGKEKEVEELIISEKQRIEEELQDLRNKLKGKKAFVAAGAVHGHSIISVLKELGIQVAGACTWHHDPILDNRDETSDSLKHVVDTYGDIQLTVCNKQSFEMVNLLNRVEPDIFIVRHSGMSIWGAKLGIPTMLIGDEQFGLGYQGIINYGQKIYDMITNSSYVKNLSKYTKLPYTKWWLEQDPFYFLGGNAGE